MTKLAGRHILLVEDEYFVAADVKRSLESLGAKIVGPVGTLDGGLDLLDSADKVDGAVLDISLRGQNVYPLADRLIEAGVPFVFLTGYDASAIPSQYANVTRFEKPLALGKVAAALM